MAIIPASFQQLQPNIPVQQKSPFEVMSGALGSYMSSQAKKKATAQEAQDKLFMNAFPSLLKQGNIGFGKNPSGKTFNQAGIGDFYYKQGGGGPQALADLMETKSKTAENIQDRISSQAKTGNLPDEDQTEQTVSMYFDNKYSGQIGFMKLEAEATAQETTSGEYLENLKLTKWNQIQERLGRKGAQKRLTSTAKVLATGSNEALRQAELAKQYKNSPTAQAFGKQGFWEKAERQVGFELDIAEQKTNFIDIITPEVDKMRKEGKTDSEIIKVLKSMEWDVEGTMLSFDRLAKEYGVDLLELGLSDGGVSKPTQSLVEPLRTQSARSETPQPQSAPYYGPDVTPEGPGILGDIGASVVKGIAAWRAKSAQVDEEARIKREQLNAEYASGDSSFTNLMR